MLFVVVPGSDECKSSAIAAEGNVAHANAPGKRKGLSHSIILRSTPFCFDWLFRCRILFLSALYSLILS